MEEGSTSLFMQSNYGEKMEGKSWRVEQRSNTLTNHFVDVEVLKTLHN